MLLQSTTTLQGSTAACRRHAAVAVLGLCRQPLRHTRLLATADRAVSSTSTTTSAIHSTSGTSGFLQSLSDEQRRPATSREQHIRVIAGPGSGKTRTIIARIIWLLKHEHVPPWSILAITFTRKAAEELKQRLEAEFGQVPVGLQARTFHSLCTSLLRSRLGVWTVAEDEDIQGIIKDILSPPAQEAEAAAQTSGSKENSSSSASSSSSRRSRGSTATKSSSAKLSRSSSTASTASSSSSSRASRRASTGSSSDEEQQQQVVDSQVVGYYSDMISRMKNFVECTHSAGKLQRGSDILQQLMAQGARGFADLPADKAQRLGTVFDLYNWRLRAEHKLDFDDLLHRCLAMVQHEPEVRAQLHRRWRHILVDEGQDTNLCQFELIRQITAPDAKLFMVGDPDQAIYGFRGARSDLMQKRFVESYMDTAVTYNLSDNYRSLQPIVAVADMIRGQLRPRGQKIVPGRSLRGDDKGTVVVLHEATNDKEEAAAIAKQLTAWRKQGIPWDEMAVLCRVKRPLRNVYRAVVAQSVPAHIQTGDMWDSPEIKAILALLRAVTHPSAAGEGLRRRIISTSAEVKVPLTAGLGPKPIDTVGAVILSQLPAPSSSAGEGMAATTLGSCLLADCGMDALSAQQAADVWQQWQAATAVQDADPMEALQGLAPPWQQLPGLKALTKPQRAGLDRLRGLVRLVAAAAVAGQQPRDVLQLLLTHSGIQEALQQAAADAAPQDRDRRANRLKHVQVLLELADRAVLLRDDADLLAMLNDDNTLNSNMDSMLGSTDGGDSSSSSSAGDSSSTATELDAPALLRQFMDLCGLQGDGNEGGQDKPRVQFMTAHMSKGKEFRCVVVTAFYEGVLPSSRATAPDDYEQERNLAYVAATRAKDRLLLTWPAELSLGPYRSEPTKVSGLLKDVLHEASKKRLPGVVVRRSG